MTDLAALFQAEGIRVNPIGPWRTRVRPGGFQPNGIVVHHTGSKGQGEDGLSTLVNGRPDLNGPLCNASPRQNGQLDLISAGRANHAGAGSRAVYERVLRDEPPLGHAAALGLRDDFTGANGVYYGLEVDNSGEPGDDYPPVQYDTTVRACAALCRHHGWTANRVILHAEHTARKVDWSLPAGPLRAAVADRLRRAQLVNGVWTIPATPAQEDDIVTPEDRKAIVDEVVHVLLHGAPDGTALVATHQDMRTLLRGDAQHPANLTAIAKKLGVENVQ